MSLPQALVELGKRPLLILCDYDGTLAPIVERPEEAHPERGARAVLRDLLHHTHHEVAVVTGRSIEVAQAFLAVPGLTVIGLHGMEWPGAAPLEPDHRALEHIARQLRPLVAADGVFGGLQGLQLEDKHWTLAVHYRNAPPDSHDTIEEHLAALEVPAGWEVVPGKKVREFRPGGFGKGRAAQQFARRFAEHHPVFIGDDVTDEEAFAAVTDLGGTAVKVGEGETRAGHRVSSPAEVVTLLRGWASGPA